MDAGRIHEALELVGLPIRGVSVGGDNNVKLTWKTPPTPAQQSAADAVIAKGERKPRDLGSLAGQIETLNGNEAKKLLALVAATWLREHPVMARKFGIDIDGDEPA